MSAWKRQFCPGLFSVAAQRESQSFVTPGTQISWHSAGLAAAGWLGAKVRRQENADSESRQVLLLLGNGCGCEQKELKLLRSYFFLVWTGLCGSKLGTSCLPWGLQTTRSFLGLNLGLPAICLLSVIIYPQCFLLCHMHPCNTRSRLTESFFLAHISKAPYTKVLLCKEEEPCSHPAKWFMAELADKKSSV